MILQFLYKVFSSFFVCFVTTMELRSKTLLFVLKDWQKTLSLSSDPSTVLTPDLHDKQVFVADL